MELVNLEVLTKAINTTSKVAIEVKTDRIGEDVDSGPCTSSGEIEDQSHFVCHYPHAMGIWCKRLPGNHSAVFTSLEQLGSMAKIGPTI